MRENVNIIRGVIAGSEKRVHDAFDFREQLDYDCFLKLVQLLPFVEARDPEVKEAVKEAEKLIRKRDQANHAFFAAISGTG